MASEVVDLFTELAALSSPPGEERPVADAVTGYLRDLGLVVEEDDAGATVGSDMGNLYCRVEPSGDGGTPIFLCAHLDTVPPEGPLEPVIEDGVIRNAGGTILGADNKSAVAAMLEGTRRVLAENRPHGDRGRGPRHLGSAPRPRRRRDNCERRADRGRERREHHSRVVHVERGSPVARRVEARRPRAGDGGRVRVRRRPRGLRGGDEGVEELQGLPLQA